LTAAPKLDVDDFPCGCILVDSARRIIFANQYFTDEFDWEVDKVVGNALESIMTPGSHLFCESYVYPLLLEKGKCVEIQLTFLSHDGLRVPVVVNADMRPDGTVAWGVFRAENRDKLIQELVDVRSSLEEQARQLQILSSTDELTGLMNRRAFNQKAEQLFARAEQISAPISLLLMDIDNFKVINDTHGHCIGDEVLREVGRSLAENCRADETVARFGGEEFVCILNEADSEAAKACAQRIHHCLSEAMRFDFPVTLSIGVATNDAQIGLSYQELLTRADHAMYDAKRAGKNCTVISGMEPDPIKGAHLLKAV
jgi:diguanylate cyclase (GGDEF)-like protein